MKIATRSVSRRPSPSCQKSLLRSICFGILAFLKRVRELITVEQNKKCGETCPVTVKVLPRTGPVEFYLVPAIDLLDCPDYRRVCFSFASGFEDI